MLPRAFICLNDQDKVSNDVGTRDSKTRCFRKQIIVTKVYFGTPEFERVIKPLTRSYVKLICGFPLPCMPECATVCFQKNNTPNRKVVGAEPLFCS